ncbi:MAG: hypothetical protein ABNH14_10695 [Pseudophaeobacter sp.]|jgi:hypothetical protein|nr:hypothetical protein N1037_14700 [Phaeobacter sp. G2]
MTKLSPPTGGGSFERQKNGGLKQVEKPTQEDRKPAAAAPQPAKEQEA